MGKGRKPTPKIVAQLLLTLTKPASVIGDFIQIQGRDWGGCAAAAKGYGFAQRGATRA